MPRPDWISAAALVALAGCATLTPSAQPQELAGTEWVLIDYQLSTESTTSEVALNKYKLSLERGGRVSMLLDCNRATGSWKAQSSITGAGQLQIGNIASTMALCSDGGIGERIAREVGSASNYSIYDGRLTLKTAAGTSWTFDRID